MKKILFSIFSLSLALVSCNKVVEPVETNKDLNGKPLVIDFQLGDATKLSYAEAEDGSYKASFSSNDAVWAYVLGALDTTIAGPYKMAIDYRTLSDDGKSASFVLPSFNIPSDATKLAFYLTPDNSGMTSTAKKTSISLDEQTSLANSLSRQVICALVPVSEIKNQDTQLFAKVPLAYKTSLIKFALKLPNGAVVDKSRTVVSMVSDNIHTELELVGCELVSTCKKGGVSANAISVDEGVVTAAMTVWAADDLTSKLQVTCGDDIYTVDFTPAKAIEAGKVYTVQRDLTYISVIERWVNDEAGSVDFAGGAQSKTSDFLSYADGKITWTENTTGKTRSARLDFDSGASFDLTQIAPSHFKGEWALKAKVFAQSGAIHPKADCGNISLVAGDPRNTEALAAADGNTYTNNLGFVGVFGTAVLDAVVDINYDERTVRVGLFLDTRDEVGQEVNGKYVTFFPGLATVNDTAWGTPWLYSETEQGDPDFSYMWLKVSEDYSTLSYQNRTSADIPLQTLTQYSSNTMNAIVGFGVVASSTNVFNKTTVTNYVNFFQINPTGLPGLVIERK